MARTRRLSLPALQALAVMLEDPTAEYWGLSIAKRIGIPTGTIYPLLHRLEALGWLESALEQLTPQEAGRPPRRLYRLTPTGVHSARAEIAIAQRGLGAIARTIAGYAL
jgi:DNA-binding PadR family transcriptional regulator